MTKLKIIHTESSEGWGGQEIRILEEINLFHKNGSYDCSVIVSHSAEMNSRNPYSSLNIIPAPIGKKRIAGVRFLSKYFNKNNPDIVISHSSTDSWLVALARLFTRKKFKIIRARHVSAEIKPSVTTRWLYRQANHIVTTSSAIKQHIEERLGIPSFCVTSVPTGVDCVKFSPGSTNLNLRHDLNIDLDEKILLMVSTLRSWKGHSIAIEAIQNIYNVSLIIVGDGPQETNLKKQVENLNLTDRVHFLGYRTDIVDLMRSADIFLQPSWANEGISQSLLQACATGLPVIAGNISGLNELIENGANGLLVNPRSSDDLHSKIELLCNSDESSKKLGANARSTVLNNHSISFMAQQMMNICNQL